MNIKIAGIINLIHTFWFYTQGPAIFYLEIKIIRHIFEYPFNRDFLNLNF